MKDSNSASYAAAGVDVTAGYESVERIKPMVKSTFRDGVLGGLGGFGGLFELKLSGMKRPVTVSGTDGVGTKLKIAFLMDKHDTVGIDCVAMCVNDIICAGAEPLFFLDYLAMGKNLVGRTADIVSGIAEGCRQANCALIGGETAEMPGFYPIDEYDVAGFSVGVVDFDKIIDGKSFKPDDVLIGLPSSGIHSNGYSLVRKVFDVNAENVRVYHNELGKTLGEELLTPTRIYVKPMLSLIRDGSVQVDGVCHITGGGFYENVPRMLPEGVKAVIDARTFDKPVIFDMLEKCGNIPRRDMYNTFNMGIGMCIAVPEADADKALSILRNAGEAPKLIGRCVSGEKGVEVIW